MHNNASKIAIVDDDELVRDSLSELLDSVGYESITYISATEFFSDYEPTKFSCILVDVRMPGMSGLDMQNKLNHMNSHVPIIIMTGHGDIKMAVQAMKDGAFEFLQKPFRDQDILDIISKALKKYHNSLDEIKRHEDALERIKILTKREREVVDFVLDGKSNKLIASELGVSNRTIELHRSNAMKKLCVNSVADLVKIMLHESSSH